MEVYLSLGSNMGDRMYNLSRSLDYLDNLFSVEGKQVSSVIETEPFGFVSSDRFLNAVVKYEVPEPGNPIQFSFGILQSIKKIESVMGRQKQQLYDSQGKRIYHSRPIDIDILFVGDARISSDTLTIPHLHIRERDFVMIPLLEIASDEIKASFPDIFF